MSKKLTVEQLEAKRQKAIAEQRELTKQIRKAKAAEKAEKERQEREREISEALTFLRRAKSTEITFHNGGKTNAYEYIVKKMNEADSTTIQ